ncbi:MAG: photosynthetic reaction center cytochrome PufC [Sphingomonadaceae bacterium]|nr:photosynthetic reaction center cytochrome PufC [Sphingomonadaceae bacterium]
MTRTPFIATTATAILLTLSGCELGPKESQQTGYRGTGLAQITDASNVKAAAVIPPVPYELEIAPDSPRASEVYQNVQVLGDLSADEFNHLMASITQMVSPEQGCTYCHDAENMADESLYTKQVARTMLRMTRSLNGEWSNHTGVTGVTCYTCHRGQPVPANVWNQPQPTPLLAVRGQKRGQNTPDANVGYSSLPTDVFTRYFEGNPGVIRVASNSAYPGANKLTTRDAEDSYAIMMHTSQALGVNCTFCHNSQSFKSWSLSRAQRATAWYGINMVRDINHQYITPLAGVFPANRKGPMGDPYKVNCLTCHQGVNKPLGGAPMITQYPYLRPAVAVAAAPQSAAAAGVPAVLDQPAEMTSDISPPNVPSTQLNNTGSPTGTR